jgi:serine/threonine protein kinase
MKNLAQLVDDLLAFRRGEIAFDAVTNRVSLHLTAAPHAAEDVLREIDSAFDSRLLEAAQVAQLKTLVADTIAPYNQQLTLRIRGDVAEARVSGSETEIRRAPRAVSRSNLALGTLLRDRFVLDEVLGAGGMGTVYKGRDLLKVEARDRNPYVAIKVLNDDFKKRDDAFIVLQREASRQQRLAHPNVATVYDFDRTGGTIFISMELLEGVPFDVYLKTEVRGRGIDWMNARNLIKGMCAALTYAHEHGIVHADFKPSNCFVLRDGKVKVLDFGIARAIKRPNQASDDVTVYDGASIGALTPAYASAEMIEGNADPHPSDDVYGLACVCYELLSGRHPYNGLSAREARYQRLVPARIERLTSRQNRALQRALAFERAARTPTVRDFFQDLTPPSGADTFWNSRRLAVIGTVTLLLIGAVAWYMIEYPAVRVLADIRSSDPVVVQAAVDRLATLNDRHRTRIVAKAKPQISAHYQRQVRRMLDTGEIDSQYGKAEATLASALALDPGSPELTQLREEVSQRKVRYLTELAELYDTYLAAGRLLKSGDRGDIQSVMQRIRIVEPRHALLSDPRVASAFANAADRELMAGRFKEARALLSDGTLLAPNDTVLRDVNDKLAAAEQAARSRERSAELASQIDARIGAGATLETLASVTQPLAALRELDPNNAALTRAADAARPLLGSNYTAITRLATVDEALAFETRYVPMFDALGLTDATARIVSQRKTLESRRDRLLSDAHVLAQAPVDRNTAAALNSVLSQIRSIAPSEPQIAQLVTTAVDAQRREAQRLAGAGRWNDARTTLRSVSVLDGSDATAAQIAQDIARVDERQQDSVRQSVHAEREAALAAERARVAAAESRVTAVLAGFSPTNASIDTLAASIAALAAIDPNNARIATTRSSAAQRIAVAAADQAKAGEFERARALLAKAAMELPGVTELATARTQVDALQGAAAQRAQELAIATAQQSFRGLLERAQPQEPRWQRDADAALSAIVKIVPAEAANTARAQLAGAYLTTAEQLTNERRFSAASQLIDKADVLTPRAAAVQARRDQWTRAFDRDRSERTAAEAAAKIEATKQRFANELKSNQLERARRTLTDLQALIPQDAYATQEAPSALMNACVTLGQSRLRAGDVAAAWRLSAMGMTLRRDDARLTQLQTEIEAAANRTFESQLGTPAALNAATLGALAAVYRTNAPARYQAQVPGWVARVRDQLTVLAKEPAAHNAYLSAVQSAFADVAALQALRPVAARQVVAPPAQATVATQTPPPASTASPSVAPVAQPQQAAPAAAPATAEPTLLGKWCGENLGITFASNEYSFDLGGRTVKYTVARYQRTGGTITMDWTDRNLGAMVMEFGDFSADGQTMTQVRGKTAAASQWQNYNRKFKRCN